VEQICSRDPPIVRRTKPSYFTLWEAMRVGFEVSGFGGLERLVSSFGMEFEGSRAILALVTCVFEGRKGLKST